VIATSPDLRDPEFLRTTELTADGADRFHATYDEAWASLRGVHGGYQTAIAVRAAAAAAPGRTVRTISATFLRPGQVGPALVEVEVVRSTRTFTTAVVTISQDGRPVVTARTTAIEPVDGHDWTTAVDDRPAPLGAAVPFTPPPQIRHFRQAELRLDPATIPTGDAADARVAGHVRPNHGGRLVDTAWLAMIGDWFPPSPFRRQPIPVGGVSVDYTVHVHRELELAAGEWLEVVMESRDSASGLALEHGTISTAAGLAVAETFHTRWTG
jgi:acyl-CoA thioesterase